MRAKNVLPLFLLLIIAGCGTEQKDGQQAFYYTGTYLDISGETFNARANVWRPDGKMICVTGRDTENVACYELTEVWDLASARFHSEFDLSNEFGSTQQISVPHGLYIRDDGKKMWVFNRTEIWAYTLDMPWEVATASHSNYKYLGEFVLRGHDIDFYPDGSRLFIDDRNAQAIHEVSLSTPWDISTIEWVYTLDISDEEDEVRGLEFERQGTLMFLMDTGRKEILIYELSEAYNLKTAVLTQIIDLSAQSDDPRGLSIRPDLNYLYVTARDKEKIYQYQRNTQVW